MHTQCTGIVGRSELTFSQRVAPICTEVGTSHRPSARAFCSLRCDVSLLRGSAGLEGQGTAVGMYLEFWPRYEVALPFFPSSFFPLLVFFVLQVGGLLLVLFRAYATWTIPFPQNAYSASPALRPTCVLFPKHLDLCKKKGYPKEISPGGGDLHNARVESCPVGFGSGLRWPAVVAPTCRWSTTRGILLRSITASTASKTIHTFQFQRYRLAGSLRFDGTYRAGQTQKARGRAT